MWVRRLCPAGRRQQSGRVSPCGQRLLRSFPRGCRSHSQPAPPSNLSARPQAEVLMMSNVWATFLTGNRGLMANEVTFLLRRLDHEGWRKLKYDTVLWLLSPVRRLKCSIHLPGSRGFVLPACLSRTQCPPHSVLTPEHFSLLDLL